MFVANAFMLVAYGMSNNVFSIVHDTIGIT